MKRSNEVTVGILVTVATIVLVLGTLWLARGGLKSGYPLYTRFSWGQNLKQGQPVLLAGVTVGYVGDVRLAREGYLEVMLRIDDKYTVPKGSTAAVKPIGIFGDVAVALTPPIPVPEASYAEGDTIRPGLPSADVDQIMTRVDSIGRTTALLLKAIETQVVAAGTLTELHKTVASTAQLTTQLQAVLVEQNRNLNETGLAARESMARIANVVDSAQIAATLNNTRLASENTARLVANLDSSNARIQRILDKVENGDGTLAKLFSDSLLYADMRRVLATSDALLADVRANPRKYINLSIFGNR
jgi:phospholipid/cholesterol/gamma-HCH transport system substrate-binding protein